MVESVLRASTLPTVIAGDFNLAPGEGLLTHFRHLGYRSGQTTQPTWKRRPYVTDHIFHNGGLELVAHTIVPTPASDHDLLIAEFRAR